MAIPRRHPLPPNPYDGLPIAELKRRIAEARKPRPPRGAPLEVLAEWLRYRIDDLVFHAHQPKWAQAVVRFTASGLGQEWDLDALIDELASVEVRLAHRDDAARAATEAQQRLEALEQRRRQQQRERLEQLSEDLAGEPLGTAVSRDQLATAIAAAGPPEGVPPVPLPASEDAVVALPARLHVVRDIGYGFRAEFAGRQESSFQSSGTSLGVRSRHWSFSDAMSSGSSSSSLSGRIEGLLTRREAQVVLDEGLLVATQARLLFVGRRESHAVALREFLGLALDGDRLAVRAPAFNRGEVFEVEDADLAGPVIAALVLCAMRHYRDGPATTHRASADRADGHAALPDADNISHHASAANLRGAEGDVSSAGAPASGAGARRERDCPWCAEPILARARVCKHCGRDVEPTE